ncbi:MAG: type II secretion system minor pseudopilin GspI [Pseudomonadota bacterium]|nr:type II secretion system minor pseudopilin GspI [Pseudomonadota bacterium]
MISRRGFSLLEVMVALAILAIALAALIKTSSEYTENLRYLRDRTVAHWVAMNVLTEVRLYQRWPDLGKQQGQMTMADHQWFWQLTVTETVDTQLRRLEIQVRAQEQGLEVLAVLVGFVGHA